jgi:hypothetical protein
MPIGLKGNTDGSGAVQIGGSDAITISTGLNTTFAGTVTASGGVLYPLTSGTAIAATSGTALDFTGIPSWAKRITVMFNQVSTSGTSFVVVQVGSSSFSTSGYASTSGWINDVGSVTLTAQTAGFAIYANTAAFSRNGIMTLALVSANTWVSSHSIGGSYSGTFYSANGGGISPALAGALDRVRITTVGGTDTFDAGSINILYE